jgi:hypothetical protein
MSWNSQNSPGIFYSEIFVFDIGTDGSLVSEQFKEPEPDAGDLS